MTSMPMSMWSQVPRKVLPSLPLSNEFVPGLAVGGQQILAFRRATWELPALERTISAEDEIWRAEFVRLVEEWKANRPPTSQSTKLAMHPAYQRIIGMGERALPLILAELDACPDHWFLALQAITGEDPVPPQAQGNLKAAAAAWIKWGRIHGLV